MPTQYFEMTPGTGASMATREVGSAHYQTVTGDLYYNYNEGSEMRHLGGGDGSTDITSVSVGTLLTDMVSIGLRDGEHPTLEAAVASSGTNKGDNGLIEIVDVDVMTEVKFFSGSITMSCRLGVMLLDGSFNTSVSGNTMTVDSPIVIRSEDRGKILTMLPLYPIPDTTHNKPGNLYNYTFHVDTGRHRTFINPSTRDIKMVFYLHEGYHRRWRSNNDIWEIVEYPTGTTNSWNSYSPDSPKMQNTSPAVAGANKMAWRITLDRTMI